MKNFQNSAFEDIYSSITNNMPQLVFFGIIVTYGITAALNIHFIPLPVWVSIPAAIAIQFGRFAVVFMDFLNPTGQRSKWPPIIATVATVVAIVELGFSIQDIQISEGWNAARYWSVFLFGTMLISFGYILELNFITKGAEAYGMTMRNVGGATLRNIEKQSVMRDDYRPTLATVTAETKREAKRPEIMRELREKQEARETNENHVSTKLQDAEVIKAAIRNEKAKLRAYRYKEINGVGSPDTVAAGIARATSEIERLQSMLP
jgi:hypothetical protein